MHQEREVIAGMPGSESSGATGTGRLLVYTQGEVWNKVWDISLHEHECSADLLASPRWACKLYMAQQHYQQIAARTSDAARGVERDQTPTFAQAQLLSHRCRQR